MNTPLTDHPLNRPDPARVIPTGIGLHPAQLGMWIFLGTVTMLFAAFLSAYLVRRVGSDWVPIALPPILWMNTAVILASSLALEMARLAGSRRQRLTVAWLLVAFFLGSLFLVGQLAAWRFLARQGIFVPTSPHSSFFYILTGLHGVHLLGGLTFLFFVLLPWGRRRERQDRHVPLRLCATYWHYLGGLWIFLFVALLYL